MTSARRRNRSAGRAFGELKAGHTLVIVTHSLQQAARISDYTAFMCPAGAADFGE